MQKCRSAVVLMIAVTLMRFAPAAVMTEECEQYAGDIEVTFQVLKEIYVPREPVPFVIAIENHGTDPVYMVGKDPRHLESFARVFDVDGNEMPHDRPREQMSVPPDHYTKIDNRRVLVVPVSRIMPGRTILSLIPDGLRLHHRHLSEDVYYLELPPINVIHEIDPLTLRQDNPHLRWFEPKTAKRASCFHSACDKVKIEIRRKKPWQPNWALAQYLEGQGRPSAEMFKDAMGLYCGRLCWTLRRERDDLTRGLIDLVRQIELASDGTVPQGRTGNWYGPDYMAINALRTFRASEAVPILLDKLTYTDKGLFPQGLQNIPRAFPAAQALAAIGMPAVDPAVELLRQLDPHSEKGILCCWVLTRILGPELAIARINMEIEKIADDQIKKNLKAAISYFESTEVESSY